MTETIICMYLIIGIISTITYVILLLIKIAKQTIWDDFPYELLIISTMPLAWIIEIPIMLYFSCKNDD